MNSSKYESMLSHKKWESNSTEDVFTLLETSEKGLDEQEVFLRLQAFGDNKLPDPKKKSNLVVFLSQFNNALIYVLLFSSIITAVMQHWLDTGVILGVVIINSIIGYIQEGKAEKALDSIRHMLSLHATVIREGKKTGIDATKLVPGDIVYLKAGDRIPADIRIIQSNNLRVEEASFTGEAEEVLKFSAPVPEGTELADRTSMVYMGTTVRNGSATGVVVEVGQNTELGKINTMMTDTKENTTPLIKKINQLGVFLSIVIVGFSVLVFLYGYLIRDMAPSDIFLTVIGIAVAAIPEGLPAIMTITLAIGVQKMAKRNAIVRKLPSVETLGSVTVICSDKTGTLTKNEMTVVSVYTALNSYSVEGAGYTPYGNIVSGVTGKSEADDYAFRKMIEGAWLCNDAEIIRQSNDTWEVIGAPTEGALKVLSMKAGIEKREWTTERIDAIPFDSNYKYMATIHSIDDDNFVFVVGAPERILALCGNGQNQEGISVLSTEDWNKKIESGASLGQRMLGVAYYKVDKNKTVLRHDDLKDNLIFLGVFGLIDPPREEAIIAVKSCKEAGITVKMITGDHALTAMSIGKEIGIGDGITSIVGSRLEEMTDEELREAVKTCHVFARTSPEHKLRIVRAIQENGEICAMTGDGVNDAPALKKADMGIAMGIKGTEVTKDASDLILADDNFASIVHAVEEGRTIYDNLRKTLLFILPTNGAEALSILIAIFAGIIMPISAPQILWINMITAVTLGISLSFEPMEENTMKRMPRHPKDPILSRYFIFRILFVSALAGVITLLSFMYWNNRESEFYARTVAVNTLVFCEMFYLFNCRKIYEPAFGKGFFGNKIILIVSGILILFQLVFTYVPFLNTLFQTERLDTKGWIAPIIGGAIILAAVEIEKFIARKIIKK